MPSPQKVPQEKIKAMLAAYEMTGIVRRYVIAEMCNVPASIVKDISEFKERRTYFRYKRGKWKPRGKEMCGCCGIRSIDKEAGLTKLCYTCFESNGGSVGDDLYKVWI